MRVISYGDPSVLMGDPNSLMLMAGRRRCDNCYQDDDDCPRYCYGYGCPYCPCDEEFCDCDDPYGD